MVALKIPGCSSAILFRSFQTNRKTDILAVGKLMFLLFLTFLVALSLKDLLAGISLTAIVLFGQTSPGKMSMYGIDGNRSRCSHFWDDLMNCVYQVGRNHQWTKCKNYREDYFECLHHKKLVSYWMCYQNQLYLVFSNTA